MTRSAANNGPIGLVAGWGDYPLLVARALRGQGYRLCGLGIKDHADERLAEHCDDFGWVGVARLGAAIRYFRRRGVRHAMMAGKVHKVLLFRPWTWLKHFPDWTCIKAFYPHFIATTKDRKDDTLLGTIASVFEAGGIQFHPATDFVPELLVKPGPLSGRRPAAGQQADIEFGWRLAKEMGRLDVGQSVVVKDRAVLAVEAIEGTDECIRRAGLLCPKGGFTVVKVAKPQQDMRFDVPTIGLGTLQTMVEAGGRVLAIEAGKTIILEQQKVVDFAQRHKLVVVAVSDGEIARASAA